MNDYLTKFFGYALVLTLMSSCGSDDSSAGCINVENAIFNESDSILLVEFESALFGEGWTLVNNLAGPVYMRWEGGNQFSNPGEGVATFNLNINTPGTYRFIWNNAVTEGDNPTEGNDSWLRFPDADDFFGEQNGGSIVYPRGIGKSPNPEGASSDGWFKIYRSGTPLDFKWQARTSDNDAHDIYVTFNDPGVYMMEVSGRSQGHAVDKFVLYQESAYSEQEAINFEVLSDVNCN